MRTRAIVIIGAFIAGLMLPATAEAALGWTKTGLNLRIGPGVGHARIAVIPRGGRVEIIGYSGNWCHVEWADEVGWVYCRYLAGVAPPGGYLYSPPVAGVDYDIGIEPFIFHHDRDRHVVKRRPPRHSPHDKKRYGSNEGDRWSGGGDKSPPGAEHDSGRFSSNDRDHRSGGGEIRLRDEGHKID